MLNKDKLSLLGMLDAIEKIEAFTNSFNNADEFYQNTVNFDATLMNFVVIGEMAHRLSEKFRVEYGVIEWKKVTNFRNIVAHDYFGVDAEEVWQVIKHHLLKLKQDIQDILKGMD